MSKNKEARVDNTDGAVAGEAAEVAYLAYEADNKSASAFGELTDKEQSQWRRVAAALAMTTAPVIGGKPSIDPITGDRLT